MKAVISTTFDDKYFHFLPLTTWAWNKLGVDVICFMPKLTADYGDNKKFDLLMKTKRDNGLNFCCYEFDAPKHKEATYAQCSRLYGACLDLPEDEILISGDVDMLMLKLPPFTEGLFSVVGADLVPDKQVPICYLIASVKQWRSTFDLQYAAASELPNEIITIKTKTYQNALDELLGDIECESFRGNYWGKDQEEAYNKISKRFAYTNVSRAKEGTQFASNRYDRDDAFILDRLNLDTIDYHMNRPGYEPQNFEIILKVLQYHYPQESFDWLIQYTEQYKALL